MSEDNNNKETISEEHLFKEKTFIHGFLLRCALDL